jgi:hypothetical protein
MIIGQAKRREVKIMCDYFKNFRILSGLRSGILERIQYYMVPRTFKLGQTLFTQGVSQVDGVYFIKDGGFEISIYQPPKPLA